MEIIEAGKVRICATATRINGKDYVDIRAYVTDVNGLLRPTQNGIMIPADRFNDVQAAAAREHDAILMLEPAPLFYFKERVEDRRAVRTSHMRHVFTNAREAVQRTPEDYGADTNNGYIFKCKEYDLVKSTYHFQPTKPFAVWDKVKNKWVRWEQREVRQKSK